MEISDKEDNNFYEEHSDHIHRYITVTINRVKSFPTANIERPTQLGALLDLGQWVSVPAPPPTASAFLEQLSSLFFRSMCSCFLAFLRQRSQTIKASLKKSSAFKNLKLKKIIIKKKKSTAFIRKYYREHQKKYSTRRIQYTLDITDDVGTGQPLQPKIRCNR